MDQHPMSCTWLGDGNAETPLDSWLGADVSSQLTCGKSQFDLITSMCRTPAVKFTIHLKLGQVAFGQSTIKQTTSSHQQVSYELNAWQGLNTQPKM